MKILVDDGLSTTVELTGIGHQCLGLFQHLTKLADVALADYRLLRHLPRKLRRAVYLAMANTWRALGSYDVIHFINYYTPWTPFRGTKVVTIHDLWMFRRPESLPPRYVTYIQRAVASALQRANLIIVPSYATREEITVFFPKTPPEKIEVCFNGLRDIFWSKPNDDEPDTLRLKDKNFFLFVGTLEERKNVALLLDCFQEARKTKAIASETMLVLVGRNGFGYEQIIRKIPDDGSVKVLGHLSDQELFRLYHRAKALVYPSLYEGFGIPLIEAMSCGMPIIRSEIAASAEIDARHNSQMFAFTLDSPRALVEKLAEIDRSAEQIRAKLNYGNLSLYQFENVARQHLDAYKLALNMNAKTF